jgi:CheY-like chemotaxis protein
MPGADGYQVAEAVGRELPGTPVLLLVGTFEVFDTDRAESAGAAGFLKKPFDSQELLRRAKDLLASGAPAPRATPAAAPSQEPAWSAAVPELPALDALPDFAAEEPVFEPVPAEPEIYEPEPEPAPPPPVQPPVAARATMQVAAPAAAASGSNGSLSDSDVDRIARRVVELIGDRAVRDVAWEVVPDLAEVLLKARIRELEASVE